MENAIKELEQVITDKIEFINAVYEFGAAEEIQKHVNQLDGMMRCIRAIAANVRFYSVVLWETGYEFGYYEENGMWVHISGITE